MELVPHFHWIKGGAVNYYLITEPEQITLIDTGMPGQLDNFLRYLSRINRHSAEVTRILVTHTDIDHVGSLQALQEETGATVYGSELAVDLIPQGRSPKHLPAAMQWLNDRIGYKPVARQHLEVIKEGDRLPILDGVKVLATPGHTQDHLSFYSPEHGFLVVGDVFNTRNDMLGLMPKMITDDIEAVRLSAIRLLELTPAVIACGHGKPLYGHKDDVLMKFYRQLA